jgi:hypothetical protein
MPKQRGQGREGNVVRWFGPVQGTGAWTGFSVATHTYRRHRPVARHFVRHDAGPRNVA